MNFNNGVATGGRYLTDDEIVAMTRSDGSQRSFRIRVWRGVGKTAIVLADPQDKPSGPWASGPNERMTCRVANYALATIAGYPDCNILYFETPYPITNEESTLYQAHFEFFGPVRRLKLYRPIYRGVAWQDLETIVGGPIER